MPSHQPSGKIFRRSWSRANYSLRSVQLQIFSHSFFFCVFCCFLAVFRALLLQMDLDQEKESNQVALKASSKANSEITLKLEAAQAEYKQLKEVHCMRFLISLVAALTIQTLLINYPAQASALEATKAAKMVAPWFLVIYAMVDISWHFSLCEGFQGAKRSRTFTQAAGDFTEDRDIHEFNACIHSKQFHTVCGGFQLDETTAMLEKSAAELEDAKKESRSNSDSMKVDLAKQNELQRTKENEIADLKTAVGFPCCTIHCCISASFTQPEHGTRNIGIARAERERSCS